MVEGERSRLILRRIQSSSDDFTVYKGDQSVGRIFRRYAAHPEGLPWMWTVEFHQRKGRAAPHQGDAPDLGAAMTAFRRCWDSLAPYFDSLRQREHNGCCRGYGGLPAIEPQPRSDPGIPRCRGPALRGCLPLTQRAALVSPSGWPPPEAPGS